MSPLPTIESIFSGIDGLEPSDFFDTCDGRRLPVYRGYADSVKRYKKERSSIVGTDKDLVHRKMRARYQKIKLRARLFRKSYRKKNPLRILEIGAGFCPDGILWSHFLECPVVAIDVEPWFEQSKNKRAYAKRWLQDYLSFLNIYPTFEDDPREAYRKVGIEFLQMDAANLKFKDRSFDLVISYNSFMEVPRIQTVICEIARILAPDGMMIATWDYFYHWMGAHRKGAIDIPWGHALLSTDDFKRFAGKRPFEYVKDFNRLKQQEWHELFKTRFDIISWEPHFDTEVTRYLPQWLKPNIPNNLSINDLILEKISGYFRVS